MKKLSFLFLCLFSVSIEVVAQSPIGYGWSTATLSTKNQEWFYTGFELGFLQNFTNDEMKRMVSLKVDNSGSLDSGAKLADQFINEGKIFLTGFTTSHDALLASEQIKLKGASVVALYIGPGHEKLAKMGDNVYTTGESMQQTAKAMVKFINSRFLGKSGLVISNLEAVFSINNRDMLKDVLNHSEKNAKNQNLEFVSLDEKLRLPQEFVDKIKSGSYQFIVMTPYADECVEVLRQLEALDTHLPIIANSSWTTIELLRRLLINRKAPTYLTSLWLKGSKDSLEFEKRLKEKYGIEANSELSYGYDAGIIISDIFKRLGKKVDQKNILKIFKTSPCFTKTSSGTICFGAQGGHAKRDIFFVEFTADKGFSLLN